MHEGTFLHERSNTYEDNFVQRDTFARIENFLNKFFFNNFN